MNALPVGFRQLESGDIACPHRDVSCCKACAAEHPEIIEVYSQHFWEPNPNVRAAIQARLARSK